MSTRIEWASLEYTEAKLAPVDEYTDHHGNTNDLPALAAGDGVVIEGAPADWLTFSLALFDSAREFYADEQGHDEPTPLPLLIENLRVALDGRTLEIRETGQPIRRPIEDAARLLLEALTPGRSQRMSVGEFEQTPYTLCAVDGCPFFIDENPAYVDSTPKYPIAPYLHLTRGDDSDDARDDHEPQPGEVHTLAWWRENGPQRVTERFEPYSEGAA